MTNVLLQQGFSLEVSTDLPVPIRRDLLFYLEMERNGFNISAHIIVMLSLEANQQSERLPFLHYGLHIIKPPRHHPPPNLHVIKPKRSDMIICVN